MYKQPRSGFTRIPYVQTCQVEVDGQERAGLICNVSVLGVYLQVEPLPAAGTEMTLRFLLPNDDLPVVARGVVTWINDQSPAGTESLPEGCGLRFTQLVPADVRRITAVVASFHNDPRPMLNRVEPQIEKVRIPFVAPCVVAGQGGPTRGNVCNLSTEGIYVTIDPIPAPGEAVIVSFRLPGQEELFERAAKVAWVNPEGPDRMRALAPGCGLRFVNLSPTDQVVLTDLVDRFAGLLVAASGGASGD